MNRIVIIALTLAGAACATNSGSAQIVIGIEEKLYSLQQIPDTEYYLSHKVSIYFLLAGVGLSDDGYVFEKRSEYGKYFRLQSKEIRELQTIGALPKPLPSYSIPTSDYLIGYSLWILLSIAALLLTAMYLIARNNIRLLRAMPELSYGVMVVGMLMGMGIMFLGMATDTESTLGIGISVLAVGAVLGISGIVGGEYLRKQYDKRMKNKCPYEVTIGTHDPLPCVCMSCGSSDAEFVYMIAETQVNVSLQYKGISLSGAFTVHNDLKSLQIPLCQFHKTSNSLQAAKVDGTRVTFHGVSTKFIAAMREHCVQHIQNVARASGTTSDEQISDFLRNLSKE